MSVRPEANTTPSSRTPSAPSAGIAPVARSDAEHDLEALSRRSGLPVAKLMDWGRRFGIPRPVASNGAATPRYTEAEAKRLEAIRAKLDAGASEQEALTHSE